MLGFISMIFLSLISPRAIHKATPIFFILVLLLNLMPVLGFWDKRFEAVDAGFSSEASPFNLVSWPN